MDQHMEEVAASIVGDREGGVWKRNDDGSRPGVHDFDVRSCADKLIALEVTTSADSDVKSLWRAIDKRPWAAKSINRSWSVILAQPQSGSGPDVRRLERRLDGLLSTLERSGWTDFGITQPLISDRETWEAVATLRRLGVTMAMSVAPKDGNPRIVIGSGIATVGEPQILNSEVERIANDNAEKLRRAEVDERHLFIWLDWTDPGAQYVLMRERIPDAPPRLPESVDVVWVAPHAIYGNDPHDVPWLRRTTSTGWSTV